MKIKRCVVGPIETNCFIVMCEETGEAMIIDPGDDARTIIDAVECINAKPILIVNTQGHADHISANGDLKKRWPEAVLAVHEADAPMLTDPVTNLSEFIGGVGIKSPTPDRTLKEGDILEAGKVAFRVIDTPGHTAGGISLALERDCGEDAAPKNGVVFTGDALFSNSVGRTDFPGGDAQRLLKSIKEKLLALPDECVVHPGHGPSTTIGREREHNIFIRSEGTIEDEEE